MLRTVADFAHHHQSRVNSDADGKPNVAACGSAGVEVADRLDDGQPAAHGTRSVVLVRARIAEVGEQPVAEILSDVAIVLRNGARTNCMVRMQYLTQLFRV